MVHQQRLNDAAIAMYATLQASGIKFGIFGGYAVSVMGGNRESKDNGFKAIPQTSEDYVTFLWSENPTVLVEIFCARFPGAVYTLQNIQATTRTVSGATLGTKPASFLDPFYIFKGKQHAAATREKFHDAADLRWLESHFRDHIKARRDKLDLRLVGLAVKRYPELGLAFGRLGVDVPRAQAAAKSVDLNKLPNPAPGGYTQWTTLRKTPS
ncbi:uncharacterized protein J3D65DRAFT_663627 [Phyllosticta citribraziliensis]|uniref:Uncharacterized protein n=1 Tax=Phyllosticta citribraziliensis TaxID=989973 RepID=A0ABR1M920_9PEZI